ncbi:MAG: hypothetical protein XE11_1091 [Methanomicrobiales archaeon 53_19]|nr:MAG: hypothetical protein XE11_1091 [Methanomicrobiales archaeon 53_19]
MCVQESFPIMYTIVITIVYYSVANEDLFELFVVKTNESFFTYSDQKGMSVYTPEERGVNPHSVTSPGRSSFQ